MKTLYILLLLVVSVPAFAQYSEYFLAPIENEQITMAREVYVVTNSGDTLNGRIIAGTFMNGQIRSFTLRADDKTKYKFKAMDVMLVAVKPTDFMNASSAMSVPNILRSSEIDMSEIMDREWIYFEKAQLPTKKEKYALMQLLNPGFDNKIKVYLNPNANETASTEINGLQLTGGEDTSYLIVKNAGKSEVIRKRRYDQEAFTRIYQGCEVFEEEYGGDKLKWRDFPEHVFVYDQLCK
jgi:hypothetical protein